MDEMNLDSKNLDAFAFINNVIAENLHLETNDLPEKDEKDLDSENQDAFVFINNFVIKNLHWDVRFLPERMWMKRILTARTWAPLSSLTTLSPRTSIGMCGVLDLGELVFSSPKHQCSFSSFFTCLIRMNGL